MTPHSFRVFLALLASLTLVGCRDKNEQQPFLFGSTELRGQPLAEAAALLLGRDAPEVRCNNCHALTNQAVRAWGDFSALACFPRFTDNEGRVQAPETEAAASAFLACLRDAGGGEYTSEALGIVSTAVRLEFFSAVFRAAYGSDWQEEYDEFVRRSAMPPQGGTPLTQEEFDVLYAWYLRDLPRIDDVFPPDTNGLACTNRVDPGVQTHVTAMETDGWHVRNAANNLPMFGCEAGRAGSDCLSAYPLSTSLPYATGWDVLPGAQIRVLYTYDHASSFWTRSSADGRFVAHGGGPEDAARGGSTIIDLAGPREISSEGNFDPSFTPDNSSYAMQGTAGGLGLCQQSVLTSPELTHVTFEEAGCGGIQGVNLYQHLAAVAGGDFFAVAGQFVSDPGSSMQANVEAAFDSAARTLLTPFIYDGAGYVARPTVAIDTPYEGDTVISPSGRLVISRMSADGSAQSGLRLRRIDAVEDGESYSITLPILAEYCVVTTKPNFSFDERLVVYHRYVSRADAVGLGFASADDPAFAAYLEQGAANLFILDLLSGEERRITGMQPGQYALFPHFRSDGLIYFVVKGSGENVERVAATDAALILAAP